jgi:putative endonuclease
VTPLAARRARRDRGIQAEEAVADFLVARGYELIARNARVGRLELDVVARRGELAVIVEVRTRGPGSFAGALASVDAKKRASLVRAAEGLWRTTLSKLAGIERMRIDVAGVTFEGPEARVEYVEAAITA